LLSGFIYALEAQH